MDLKDLDTGIWIEKQVGAENPYRVHTWAGAFDDVYGLEAAKNLGERLYAKQNVAKRRGQGYLERAAEEITKVARHVICGSTYGSW